MKQVPGCGETTSQLWVLIWDALRSLTTDIERNSTVVVAGLEPPAQPTDDCSGLLRHGIQMWPASFRDMGGEQRKTAFTPLSCGGLHTGGLQVAWALF